MRTFFSARLAPGVRVSVSGRGLRAHLGPRAARLHVGAGGAGVSTGVGPLTVYRPLEGDRGRRRRTPDRGSAAAQIAEALAAVGNLHRHAFAEAVRPQAPAPEVPSMAALEAEARRDEYVGVPWWQLSARAAARRRARAAAQQNRSRLRAEAQARRDRLQEELDAHWQALLDNEPEAVLAALAKAFEDNEAPVAPVGSSGDEVVLVVLVPGPDVLPDRYPTTTAAGDLSLERPTRTTVAGWYRQLVAGHAVVSAREAFAVCPGLDAARVVVLRDEGADAYGGPRARPVLATRFTREALSAIRWETVTAWDVVEDAGTETLTKERGATRELQPLDLEHEPDLAAIASCVDLEELVEHDPGRAPLRAEA